MLGPAAGRAAAGAPGGNNDIVAAVVQGGTLWPSNDTIGLCQRCCRERWFSLSSRFCLDLDLSPSASSKGGGAFCAEGMVARVNTHSLTQPTSHPLTPLTMVSFKQALRASAALLEKVCSWTKQPEPLHIQQDTDTHRQTRTQKTRTKSNTAETKTTEWPRTQLCHTSHIAHVRTSGTLGELSTHVEREHNKKERERRGGREREREEKRESVCVSSSVSVWTTHNHSTTSMEL